MARSSCPPESDCRQAWAACPKTTLPDEELPLEIWTVLKANPSPVETVHEMAYSSRPPP